jgi:curli biogenesis system outer membrane secretion channel CsgG
MLAATALAACGITSAPERAYEVREPKSQIARTFTNFNESLQCMDVLLMRHGIRNVVITSDGIPDATSKVNAGTKDMLISAVSKMSVRSKAFAFVDFDQNQEDIASLHKLVGFTDEFRVPNYYIRGAITQLDEGVLAESIGGSLAFTDFEFGASKDQVVSVISTDMNVGQLTTRQILPGISASNSIVVRRSGIGGDVGATIKKVGLSFNISINKQEGMHQATRTLIELSAIEILGKLTKVPYWQCLQIEQTNPHVIAEAREWFKGMSKREQVSFAQRALASAGDYAGPVNGRLDQSTKSAVARYQARKDQIASGRVNFDLYRSLIAEDLALGEKPASFKKEPLKVKIPDPLQISMTTPRGISPVYRVKETLKMTVKTSRDAYVYCYYRDARGTIARVFPNKFNPDPYVIAGRSVSIPGEKARFGIVFDRPNAQEKVLCVASHRELGLKLPDGLRKKDLAPLPVSSLDEVVSAYQKLDSGRVAQANLSIRVEK